MWNLKKCYRSSYLQNRNKETDTDNKCRTSKGEGGEMNWEIGIDKYRLLISSVQSFSHVRLFVTP